MFDRLLRLSSYLLSGVAFAALASTGELNPAYLILAACAFPLGILASHLGLGISGRAWTAFTLIFVLFSLADLFLLSDSVILTLGHFLLYLMVNKLFNLKTNKDYYELYAVSFFQLLVASVLTIHFSFALFFLAYLVMAIFTLVLFQFKREGANLAPARLAEVMDASLLMVLSGAVMVALALTMAIFFIVPRIGLAMLQLKMKSPFLMAGFADRVELGSFDNLVRDPTVAMRVKVEGIAEARLLTMAIKWRGATYDTYDGQAWLRKYQRPVMVYRNRAGPFFLESLSYGEELMTQEVYLGDMVSRVLFASWPVVKIEGQFPFLTRDAAGSIFAPYQAGWKRSYVAYSRLPRQVAVPREELPARIKEQYLALPQLSPRLKELAASIVGSARDPYQKGLLLEEYLRRHYRYSLDVMEMAGPYVLEKFLFEQKAGHCELFATSFALMARAVGVPTRYVTGFVRGEYNEFGGYFLVRHEDAHAWVEAFIPGKGWVTFDPTPRPLYYERPSYLFLSAALRYLDFLRLKWNRLVVEFSASDQINALKEVRRRSLTLRADFNRYLNRLSFLFKSLAGWPGSWRWGLLPLAAGLLAFLFIRLARGFTLPGPSRAPLIKEAKFYTHLLAILARHGKRKKASATPQEFAQELAREGLNEVLLLTDAYYKVRYAGLPLTEEEKQRVRSWLAAIRSRISGKVNLSDRPGTKG